MAAKKTTTPAAKKTPAIKPTTPKPAAKKVAAKTPAVKATAVKTPAAKATAAKKVARVVPKTSPLKGMSVEDYAKGLAGWQAEAVTKLVALVKLSAPGATVSIKWAQPVFDDHGPFAYIKPAKAHVTLGFWRGAEFADPKGLLRGDNDRMRSMKLGGLAAIDEKALAAFVKEAVKLNRAKGDPTKRA